LLWSLVVEADTTPDDDWNQIVHSASAPINEWQHVAITYSGTTMRLYVDGALAGSMPRPAVFTAETVMTALVFNPGWDTPFLGQIDEFIVYDYALSSLDINGAAINNLTDPSLFAGFVKDALELGDLSAVRGDFELPPSRTVRIGYQLDIRQRSLSETRERCCRGDTTDRSAR
jgi:arabinan endo-1,5-alpha-L-arabinosidase